MIFKPKLARLIIRGKKTETRRPVRWVATDDVEGMTTADRKKNPRSYVDADYPNKALVPCRYQVDHDYALQTGRGKAAVEGIRLLVVAVSSEPERVGDLTLEGAIAEGFRTRQEFFDYWAELYGECDPETLVWVIRFKPTFEDRFMTDNLDPRKGPLDITPSPPATGGMRAEPQLVPKEFEDTEATLARGRDEIREIIEHPERIAERNLLTKQNKLRKLQQEARRHRIDISPELDRAIAAVQGKIAVTRRAA